MKKIEFISELFTSSNDNKVDFAFNPKRNKNESIKFSFWEKTISPLSDDAYSNSTVSTASDFTEEEFIIDSQYGLTTLPPILYTSKRYLIML